MTPRRITQLLPAIDTQDGGGVRLRRALGAQPGARLDPLLMLDAFSSDDPNDYIAGFPAHPHRGFETVTYILDGHMLHEDHLGNRGDLMAGGVQWMTAGRGIIHSEMPQQTGGRLRGFQLWINLPAGEKMKPASYRDIPASDIPRVELPNGTVVRVIAGNLALPEMQVEGPICGGSTDPIYLDVTLPANGKAIIPIPEGHNFLSYIFEGSLSLAGQAVPNATTAILGEGDVIELHAGSGAARCLLIGGKPLHEPIVQYGPFVMNTRQEIEQAMRDYQAGRLV
ncbi:MAG: pirin family protein [Gammaproteobacteria bacterium]|nr:pirin family protein [Gammaproteobacteria bacterium]